MKRCTKCGADKDESEFYFKSSDRLSSYCKCCHNKTVKKWQEKNRDKVRLYIRKSCKKAYDEDPEKYREKSRATRAKNPEKARAIVNKSYQKLYKARHAHERARLNAASAARRRLPPNWLDAISLAQIKEMYDIAKAVTIQTGIKHHVDHIIPLNGAMVNGLHVPWNLQVIPASENCAKGAKVAVI